MRGERESGGGGGGGGCQTAVSLRAASQLFEEGRETV